MTNIGPSNIHDYSYHRIRLGIRDSYISNVGKFKIVNATDCAKRFWTERVLFCSRQPRDFIIKGPDIDIPTALENSKALV